jgi:hypothetical protein
MSKKTGTTVSGESVRVDEDMENDTALEDQGPTSVLDRRDAAIKRALEGRKAELEAPAEAETHPGVYLDPAVDTPAADQSVPDTDKKPDEPTKIVATDEKVVDDEPKPAAKAGAESPIFEKDGAQYMRLKVNGEVLEMPVDKVQGIAQKNLTADNRLREATERLREAEKLKQSLQEQQTKLQSSLAQPPKKGVEVNEAQIEASSKDFITALFSGTQEDALEKFTRFQKEQMLNNRSGADIEELMRVVTETAEKKARDAVDARERDKKVQDENADINFGFKQLQKEYPALLNDDILFGAVDSRTEQLRAQHPDMKPSQIMLMAAKEVMDRVQPPKPVTAPAATPQQIRKAALKPVPQVRTGHQAPARGQSQQAPTQAQIAERMKAQRTALRG